LIRTALVTPWFGPQLAGEAERHVFEVATRLAARGHAVEVLTTCGRSADDPRQQDHFPEGSAEESGLLVRRFPLRRGDAAAFDSARRQLTALDGHPKQLGVSPVAADLARAFVDENVHAPRLLEHLDREGTSYRAVVFAPYWCGPTLLGVQRVRERAFLLPFLRDETCAYLPAIASVFLQSKRVLFASEEEALLAARLFGPSMWRKGRVVGAGAADAVVDRYEEALELRPHPHPRRHPVAPRRMQAIHQVTAGIDYGDAISNQTLFIAEVLRAMGYRSEILAGHVGASMADLARVFAPDRLAANDGLLYHHAIGSPLVAAVTRHQGPKALVYHNITPGHFFERWDPSFVKLLDEGRNDLRRLAPLFVASAGDSGYNVDELREAGFRDPGVVPIFVDPMRWAFAPDPEWMRLLQDGRTNLLFVGRVAPNKCQHHLVEAFREYLRHDADARLILAGIWPEGHPYVRFLREEADRLGVARQVLLTFRLTEAQLLACYRTADLFWSMSEHEGFCVPIVEAMWFDVPVLAYRSSAIPETLGPAGLMFTEKRWPEVAALAHLLVEDRALRRKVIGAQRQRRKGFLPEAVLPSLLDLIRRLDAAGPAPEPHRPIAEINSKYASMMRGQR
jgi:glycosyltransferase involved in cell wall biosynthesis